MPSSRRRVVTVSRHRDDETLRHRDVASSHPRHVGRFSLPASPGPIQEFVKLVRTWIGPFVRAAYPDQINLRTLIDGEPRLHTDGAKAALSEVSISALPGWPAYSPELNPQENLSCWQ